MKKIILLLSLTLCSFAVHSQTNATQVDTSQYKDYKVYEQWKTKETPINPYATGQSKSQQRTLRENSMASQASNTGKTFFRTLLVTISGAFLAATTLAIMNKTNQSTNALFH